jgi:hypothetical protein
MFANDINVLLSHKRIPAKQTMSLATIAVVLAACGPATASQTVEIIAFATPAISEPYTTTATQTEILHTPTAMLSPTETAVPRPRYSTEAHKEGDFTAFESLAQVVQDIEGNRELTKPVTLDFAPITEYEFGGSSEGIYFKCKMGANCKTRAFVKVEAPEYGIFRYYIILEVRNPGDEQSNVLVLDITPDTTNKNDFTIYLESNLERFYKSLVTGNTVEISILTHSKRDGLGLVNPANRETYKNYPPEVQEMREKLKFPDKLSGVPLLQVGFD